tara:strand:- start:793 stop:1134 length:342 start_codon:yes stop_codon:yes gene_type:complete
METTKSQKPNGKIIGKGMKTIKSKGFSQEEQLEAKEFALSSRGQLLMAQALSVASAILKDKEKSNSDDMIYIGERLFQPYWMIYNSQDYLDAQEQVMKLAQEKSITNKEVINE